MTVCAQRLDTLLDGYAPLATLDDVMVHDVTADSRQVRQGALFLAIRGLSSDGREYIPAAVAAGAAAVAFEADDGYLLDTSVPSVGVAGLNEASGFIADRFFASPSAHLRYVVGITGTNGKTTCAWLIAQALESLGMRCGVIGTLGSGFVDDMSSGELTTPDAVSLHRSVAALKDSGATSLAIEISSHALDQGRANGLRTSVAVFTNLTQDHLDYHGTMANYAAAKARLFEKDFSHAVINIADDFGRELAGRLDPDVVWSFGTADARVQVINSQIHDGGLALTLSADGEAVELSSKLIGKINIENLVCAFTVLCALGFKSAEAARVVGDAGAAPGRMEYFSAPGRPGVVVDFAHTPDALAKALDAVHQHLKGELWCVFGCGGDRDAAKRPLMGAAAQSRADHVVLTNDNPRNENAASIVDDIKTGMSGDVPVVADREAAIEYALNNAKTGDIILVAGKGHETTQTTAGRVVEVSDREIVPRLLGMPIEERSR